MSTIDYPAVGFGCYNAKGGDNYQMICDAIASGYRLFDTASVYETERDLGRAIKESGIPREEFLIQSKLWLDEMGAKGARDAINRSLERLGVEYLDVYLIHWPRQTPVFDSLPGYSGVTCEKPFYETIEDWKALVVETYREMEKMVEEGLIRAIGLSNFLPHHLMVVLDNCRIRPIVDQLEVHIGYTQEAAVSFAKEQGLVVQAWSPLGRSEVLSDPYFTAVAKKYGVTVAQLGLRFLYQLGVVSLPKSASPERQKQNLDILGFEIDREDFYTMRCMPTAYWQREHPDFVIPARGCPREQ